MINHDLNLNPHLLSPEVEMEPTRAGFGRGLLEAGRRDKHVVALCADLTESTQISHFADAFPERYFEVGIAEQNLVTVAAGLAAMGNIPFTSSYAAFSPGRNWEQIKTTSALNDRAIVVVGSHAGLYTGLDGATHQMLEDIAIMRTMPNMRVVVPCDSHEAERATLALASHPAPSYLRLARDKSAIITTVDTPFVLGQAYTLVTGTDITIVACGTMVYQAILASELLRKKGISAEVINCPVIKPLDSTTILKSARKTGAVVTVEEAQIIGGLGSAVAELLIEQAPMPMSRMGVQDRFGETGRPDELLKAFGLLSTDIAKRVRETLKRKK
jgi:transketolase